LNSRAYFRYRLSSIPFLLMFLVYSIRTFPVSTFSGQVQNREPTVKGLVYYIHR
jgi:hypothetical protein